MGLTRCYKTAVFLLFIFAVFRSQSIAEILPLPHLENKRMPYRNCTSGFNFELFIVIFMYFCKDETNIFFWIRQSQRELWVMTLCRFFKMAAISSQIFFCFLVSWHLAFRKAKNYLRIKFRPNISIHGQVITTSGCSKQTSAIFKFYSKLRWTLHRHRHFVILHWPTKFLCKSDDRRRSYDVILIFARWRP